jgi:hypothetical protein
MKRVLMIALTLMLILSMSISAFAAAVDSGEGSVSVTVNAYAGGNVYAITYDWTKLAFTYSYTGWDSQNRVYTGSWDKLSADITVTNNSNVAVKATSGDITDADVNDKVSFAFVSATAGTHELAIGDSYTFTVEVRGTPDNVTKQAYNAATVGITIDDV